MPTKTVGLGGGVRGQEAALTGPPVQAGAALSAEGVLHPRDRGFCYVFRTTRAEVQWTRGWAKGAEEHTWALS